MPDRNFVTIAGRPVSAAKKVLATTPAKVVAALVAAGLLAGGVASTGAGFRDQVQVTAEVGAGTLDLAVNGEQGNPEPVVVNFTLPDGTDRFVPGTTMTQVIQLGNDASTIPATVTGTLKGTGPAALGSQLDVKITATPEGGQAVTSTGKAQNLSLPAFGIEPGQSVPVEISLTLPASTTDAWQGKTDVLTFTLTAVQS